jgi:CubicO group peptidase (beta-lactamase class C family)
MMSVQSFRFMLSIVVATMIGLGCAVAQQQIPADIDIYVERARTVFEVPGIAVAIVKDGRVALARGYGLRRLGGSEKVDSQTLFGIASNTKAFTATALALLVEEGKIRWDAPVIDYLPSFRLSDPYVTSEITVRDLLVHRSGLGLGAGDLLWWPPSTYNRKEITHRLRFIPLQTSFRSAYAYDNVLYTVAGEVIETVSGQTWEDFVSSRILAKVGMNGSNVRHSAAGEGKNVATPHASVDGKVQVVKPFASDNTNPAGGVNSSAEDMARWLIVQLDSGRVADGPRLFSPQTTKELWSMVTPIPIGTPAPELRAIRSNFMGYALGFGVQDYRGKKIVRHTGGLPGYVSRVTMVPELKLGVAVLTNQESREAYEAITNYILDSYLDAPQTDWIRAYQKVRARAEAAVASVEHHDAMARNAASRPSLPLARYAGTYTDAWYGDVVLAQGDSGLTIQFSRTPVLQATLVHWQYDTFIARWTDRELRADAFVTFSLNPDGSIDRIRMKAVSPATDFSFDFHDLDLRPSR